MTPREYASTGLHLFYLDDIKAGEGDDSTTSWVVLRK